MANQESNDGYALVQLWENGIPSTTRRIRSCVIQADDGDVRYYEGAAIPFTQVVLYTGVFNEKRKGKAQILGVPAKSKYVDNGPAWPIGRFVVISLCITGILHAMANFVLALV